MSTHNYLVCVSNEKYSVSLEPKKLYEVLPDPQAETRGMVRVIDESGEDYLFPAYLFMPVALPESVIKVLEKLAA